MAINIDMSNWKQAGIAGIPVNWRNLNGTASFIDENGNIWDYSRARGGWIHTNPNIIKDPYFNANFSTTLNGWGYDGVSSNLRTYSEKLNYEFEKRREKLKNTDKDPPLSYESEAFDYFLEKE